MKSIFKTNKCTVWDEKNIPHVMYGIDAVEDGVVQASVNGAFDSREKAEELARKCTEYDLAPEHLKDVVEDALMA